jgi:TetR/AcrR family transcriptional regulator, regulator of cefoperazone and chloramphenicol sensitivity
MLDSMSNSRTALTAVAHPRNRPGFRQRTRAELLESAGQVFAEKGFDRATGKEICERAGANAAAINYYFGGMDGLYAAVLEEANQRLVPVEKISAAIAGKKDARSKLQAIFELVADKLMGPTSSSWVFRVFSREIMAPSPAIETLVQKQGLPKGRIARSIVSEIMGLPEDHPAVARGCISVLAPMLMLFIADRRILKRMFPSLGLRAEDTKALARHALQFSLAGLAAVAREARKEDQDY